MARPDLIAPAQEALDTLGYTTTELARAMDRHNPSSTTEQTIEWIMRCIDFAQHELQEQIKAFDTLTDTRVGGHAGR